MRRGLVTTVRTALYWNARFGRPTAALFPKLPPLPPPFIVRVWEDLQFHNIGGVTIPLRKVKWNLVLFGHRLNFAFVHFPHFPGWDPPPKLLVSSGEVTVGGVTLHALDSIGPHVGGDGGRLPHRVPHDLVSELVLPAGWRWRRMAGRNARRKSGATARGSTGRRTELRCSAGNHRVRRFPRQLVLARHRGVRLSPARRSIPHLGRAHLPWQHDGAWILAVAVQDGDSPGHERCRERRDSAGQRTGRRRGAAGRLAERAILGADDVGRRRQCAGASYGGLQGVLPIGRVFQPRVP